MKRLFTPLALLCALVFLLLLAPKHTVLADCARPATTYGNVVLTASCTYSYTIDGVDNPQNSESSTTNSATITLGDYNLTLSSSQKIIAGQFIINGAGGIAIGSGQLLVGNGLWIDDADADGWFSPTAQYYDASAPGRRRIGLMKSLSADCDDGNGQYTNNCYSYSESTYYNYGQANYYAYSQSNYYAYSQSSYYSYSYGYGQASYYGYGQSSYGSYGGCFLAGTKVLMADGTLKEIQDIRPGDVVLSYDLTTETLVPNPVAALLVHTSPSEDPESQEAGYLVINGTLRVTKGHNIWVENRKAWLRADAIRVNDMLLDPQGNQLLVGSITAVDENPPVYNLSLPGEQHNYFTEGILVHNVWKN